MTKCIPLTLSLLAACQAEPGVPDLFSNEPSPGPVEFVPVLTGMRVAGPYQDTYVTGDHPISCLYNHDRIELYVVDLDTEHPGIASRPDLDCEFEAVASAGAGWLLLCSGDDTSGGWTFETRFTLDIDDAWPHHGELHWEIDALPDFYCLRVFGIDDVSLTVW